MSIANNKLGETEAELQENLKWTCNKTLPKRRYNNNKKDLFIGWTKDIADARAQCIQARRRYTKVKRRTNISNEDKEQIHSEYKNYKDILTKKIETAKKTAWNILVEELERDIWGKLTKLSEKKFKSSDVYNKTDQELINEANKLFPRHRKIRWTRHNVNNRQVHH